EVRQGDARGQHAHPDLAFLRLGPFLLKHLKCLGSAVMIHDDARVLHPCAPYAGICPNDLSSIKQPAFPRAPQRARVHRGRLPYRSVVSAARLASKRNHARRSASSIHTSSRLAVATSPCSSHTPCTSRMRSASNALSSRNSASMSRGVTNS